MPSCPHCGAKLTKRASFCRACGSDARTGWNDPQSLDSRAVEVPEFDEEDYQDFLAREGFGGRRRRAGRFNRWWAAAIIIITLLGFCLYTFRR